MPFLRFSRDKRGYETTSLMHSFRGRGDARPRLLYWYRTPPDVKVGRTALDEEAIRTLEESNPELTFDWSRILHSRAIPQPTERPQARRAGRATGGRAPREREITRQVSQRAAPAMEMPPPEPAPPGTARSRSGRRRRRSKGLGAAQLPFPDKSTPAEAVGGRMEGIEERGTPAAEVVPSPEIVAAPPAARAQTPLETDDAGTVGPESPARGSALDEVRREDLARLRARYSEIQARITQQVTDPQRLERLRTLAEQINPDAWVTAEEVASGLAEFEALHNALKGMLGRRRRRSRRGGLRHRRGRGAVPAVEPAQSLAPDVSRSEPSDDSGTDGDPGADQG